MGVRLSERWSIGGGLRYVDADYRYGFSFGGDPGFGVVDGAPLELSFTSDGRDHDLSWDLGIQYAAPSWGWGAVYRHWATLTSRDAADVDISGIDFPPLADLILNLYGATSERQSYVLPEEVVVGGWIAPRQRFRLELDLAYADWPRSETVVYRSFFLPGGPEGAFPLALQERPWDDTLSIRLGAELDLGRSWLLSAGLASEPSPVPGDLGFPGGAALVYSIGLSHRWAGATLDAAYSYWDYDDRDVLFVTAPGVLTSYGLETSEHVASVSVRWKL